VCTTQRSEWVRYLYACQCVPLSRRFLDFPFDNGSSHSLSTRAGATANFTFTGSCLLCSSSESQIYLGEVLNSDSKGRVSSEMPGHCGNCRNCSNSTPVVQQTVPVNRSTTVQYPTVVQSPTPATLCLTYIVHPFGTICLLALSHHCAALRLNWLRAQSLTIVHIARRRPVLPISISIAHVSGIHPSVQVPALTFCRSDLFSVTNTYDG
jgi:hypothetical protein